MVIFINKELKNEIKKLQKENQDKILEILPSLLEMQSFIKKSKEVFKSEDNQKGSN